MKDLILLTIFCLILSGQTLAFDKSQLDIQTNEGLQKGAALAGLGYELHTRFMEASLAKGGYFTLGTAEGLSASQLDDNCGLSFGHPYALTSFPVLAIDGTWGKAETFFDVNDEPLFSGGQSIFAVYVLPGLLEFRFEITESDDGKSMTVASQITNLDEDAHNFGLGLVFDPGLGKRGDGWLEVTGKMVLHDSLLEGSNIPQELNLKEKTGGSAGIKMKLAFNSDAPQKLIIANWETLHRNSQPDFAPTGNQKLYDLALKMLWNQAEIAPGNTLTKQIVFELQQPDFDNPVFVRWNLPGAFSIENGLLFPNAFETLLEVHNLTSTHQGQCTVYSETPEELQIEAISDFQAIANDVTYRQLKLNLEDIYEDMVYDLKLEVRSGTKVLDSVWRRVFVPATPISDTGLVCKIDSIDNSNFPEVGVEFHAEVAATQVRIKNLAPKNIFLYENEQRIHDFTLEKNLSGGSDMADVVFVIDCSGSMSDDIAAVRNNVQEFCESLQSNGYDFRLGLVVFSDNVHVLSDMTNDINTIRDRLASVNLYGGRENSLGGIWAATELSLRPGSRRSIIWITDEDYPVSPEINLSVQDVVNQLLQKGIELHSISLTSLQTNWSNPLIEPTGGKFYSITGNFRDILLDISNLGLESGYLLTYHSPNASGSKNIIRLELHYAGLGGFATAEYSSEGTLLTNAVVPEIQCYPNPFNPAMNIQLSLPENSYGEVRIFNILGQQVQTMPIKAAGTRQLLQWNARDMHGQEVAAGTYFVKLTLYAKNGQLLHQKMTKVLHLK